MSELVLTVRGLSKSFDSAGEHLVILRDLDFSLSSGKRVVILGESGCGKSTFLNIVGGLESATTGTVRAGPYDVHGLSERELSSYRGSFVGLVFQFHYLLKDFTALENVMLPALMRGMKRREATERARSLLADVNLESRASHYPSQMSGGERQRAAVARALVNEPELVLADEPTGNLDPANAEVVRELLFSVVTRHGKALLLVTHDAETATLADERYRLAGGKLETA